jgi:hypothetical protein
MLPRMPSRRIGWKLALFAVVLACFGASTMKATAEVTCFCEIASAWDNGTHNAGQLSLTSTVNKKYDHCENGCFFCTEQCDYNQHDCGVRCNGASLSYVKSQSFANTLCAKGIADGTVLNAYSHVGTVTGENTNQTIGTLTNIPAVSKTECTCPKPWLNNDNVAGGPTGLDKFCKIGVCHPITPGPGTSLPPNGTGTSTSPRWWTWGNGLYESAPIANCVTTLLSPAQCSFEGKWTRCATEGGVCVFTGFRRVRYGAGAVYTEKTVANGTPCDNTVFGDPVPGTKKVCDYLVPR